MEIKMSEKMTYKVLKQEGRAKRAVMETVHGTIQTPVFMNVGTVAAIKGAVSTEDLEGLGTQVELFQHLSFACASPVMKRSRRWADCIAL